MCLWRQHTLSLYTGAPGSSSATSSLTLIWYTFHTTHSVSVPHLLLTLDTVSQNHCSFHVAPSSARSVNSVFASALVQWLLLHPFVLEISFLSLSIHTCIHSLFWLLCGCKNVNMHQLPIFYFHFYHKAWINMPTRN